MALSDADVQKQVRNNNYYFDVFHHAIILMNAETGYASLIWHIRYLVDNTISTTD